MTASIECLAAQGNIFFFEGSTDVPVFEEAQSVVEAFDQQTAALGGWTLDIASVDNFASLMKRREAGDLAWTDVVSNSSSTDSERRKLPYSMLTELGYPCWAMNRAVYSLDLFNPGGELGFGRESEDLRLWQLVPWPSRFVPETSRRAQTRPTFADLATLIRTIALTLETRFGGGGGDLEQFVYHRGRGTTSDVPELTHMSYPYMVLPRTDIDDTILERISNEEFEAPVPTRVAVCETFGNDAEYVLIGLSGENESFPLGNRLLGSKIGELLGRPYIGDVVDRLRAGKS